MKMEKSDLLKVQNILAEQGVEITSQEILDILVECKPDLKIVDDLDNKRESDPTPE